MKQPSATLAVIFLLIVPTLSHAWTLQTKDSLLSTDVELLKANIINIMSETGVPAVGVAIVTKSGTVWVDGLGKANVERNIPADKNTVFRLASVSKIFVAMAMLKLEEDSKLNLNDKVRDVAPEVNFKNPWEESDPVRLIHLLNHTTGWDDIHPPEVAHNDSIPILLRDALNFHPHSRNSRWIPGSRNAYSNSGYGVAGYIVEKLAGMPYEDFIQTRFLNAMGMSSTTFFDNGLYQKYAAVNYDESLKPLPYRNLLFRPSGAMSASPVDMTKLLSLLLNRGISGSHTCISSSSVEKMQTPQTTPAANAGLTLGYGLAHFTSVHNSFVFYGHNGTLDGGLAELAYLPDHGMGYVILMNATKPGAFHRIRIVMRNFVTDHFQKDTASPTIPQSLQANFDDGYYIPINPRNESLFFLDLLLGSEYIRLEQNRVVKSWLFPFGQAEYFVPKSDSTFLVSETNAVGMVKAEDPLAGKVLSTDRLVMKRIPAFIIFGQLFVLLLWIALTVYVMVFWTINGLHSLVKSRRTGRTFQLYGVVTVTSLLYISLPLLVKNCIERYDEVFAKAAPFSIALLIASVLIMISCLVSIVFVYRNRQLPPIVWYPVMILSALHLFVTGYLISLGVIPVVTWS